MLPIETKRMFVDFDLRLELLSKRKEIAKQIRKMISEYCGNIDSVYRPDWPRALNIKTQVAQLKRFISECVKASCLKALKERRYVPRTERAKIPIPDQSIERNITQLEIKSSYPRMNAETIIRKLGG